MAKKVSMISLGCPKNLVDSENILALLGEKNFIITDSYQESDIVIINTCAFIKEAVEESIEVIREVAENKEKRKIVVCGCLAQRFKKEIFNIADIDGIVGVGNPGKVVEVVEKIQGNEKLIAVERNPFQCEKTYPRLLTTFPYAYLKIAEGCANRCNYCLIPFLRGSLKSRKINDIVKEAEDLLKLGIKEIVLVAQDTTSYGKDLKDGTDLIKLLKELTKLDYEWIRIMYCHPAHLNDRIIEFIAENKKICKYLDIPMQHSHPEILKKMGRPVVDYYEIVEKIREKIKDVSLRTTFIVGFPGEREEHFRHLVEFIKTVKFNRCGFFSYSKEKGTAAYNLTDQIDEQTKQKRLEELVEIQNKISETLLESMVGKTCRVLIEGKESKYYIGRTEYDAPVIDGIVYVKGKNLKIGDFCTVKITSSFTHDLFGEVNHYSSNNNLSHN